MNPDKSDAKKNARHLHPISFYIIVGIFALATVTVFLLAEFDTGTAHFLHRFITSPEILITIAPILILLMAAFYYLATRPSSEGHE